MSWISDLIKGEIAEQKKAEEAEKSAAGADDAETLKTMLRDIIREEVKTMVADEVKAAAVAPKAEEAPKDEQKKAEAPAADIKAEIKKALAESLNSIPAKTRSIEESYDRVFNN